MTFFTSRKKKEIRWHKTFRQNDKIPFGSNAIYQLIRDEFYKGKTKTKKLPVLQLTEMKKAKGVSCFFLNDELKFDEFETQKLLSFMRNGNKVFMSANYFSGALSDSFKLETTVDLPYIDERGGNIDSTDKRVLTLKFLNPNLKDLKSFEYDRLLGYSAFSGFDTLKMSVVAADDSGRAVCIHAKIGKGDLYLVTLPDVFTNFYIVNHPSRFFAYQLLSFMNCKQFWWDEYYKTENGMNQNPFRFMIENDSLYYAFWIALIATMFFMFFGMKRSQRQIPVKKPKANATLQFVEVVGSVYFSTENHKIIAEEKILVFFELLRNAFQIKSSEITEEDMVRISKLSTLELNKVHALVANIQYIYSVSTLSEKELISFNKRMEEFYTKNQRK